MIDTQNGINMLNPIITDNNIIKGINISIDKSTPKYEDTSTRDFNEWYKSFYNFGEKTNSSKTNNDFQNQINEIKELDTKLPKQYKAESAIKGNYNDMISIPKDILNDQNSEISCFSKKLSLLESEKILSNFPFLTNEVCLNQIMHSNKIMKKQSSIIFNSKRNTQNKDHQKTTEYNLNSTKKLDTNSLDFSINKNNFSLSNETNNHAITQKLNADKHIIFKPEQFKVTENKGKSAKEVFLLNLSQFKKNQPQENIKFIEQIENNVKNVNENLNKINVNESNRNNDDPNKIKMKDIFSHKLFLKNFQNKEKEIQKETFNNIVDSAKGRFIRNFLNSNESIENMCNNQKRDCSQGDLNYLQSPNQFLKELIEFRYTRQKGSSCLPFADSRANILDEKLYNRDISSTDIISYLLLKENLISPPNFNHENSFDSLLEKAILLLKRENKDAQNRKGNCEKDNSDNLNFEIDIFSNANKTENEDNSEKKKFENKFLGLKNKFILQNQTKNFRKKGSKYKMFSLEDKKFCLDLLKIFNYNAVAKLCNIPVKSLKRWALMGPERKKGGGRKTRDPEMEAKLIKWIKEQLVKGEYLDTKMIKKKALKFTKNESFLASKGWFNKFQKKYKFELPYVKKQMNYYSKVFGVLSNEYKDSIGIDSSFKNANRNSEN
jgi:hypothetical protein